MVLTSIPDCRPTATNERMNLGLDFTAYRVLDCSLSPTSLACSLLPASKNDRRPIESECCCDSPGLGSGASGRPRTADRVLPGRSLGFTRAGRGAAGGRLPWLSHSQALRACRLLRIVVMVCMHSLSRCCRTIRHCRCTAHRSPQVHETASHWTCGLIVFIELD